MVSQNGPFFDDIAAAEEEGYAAGEAGEARVVPEQYASHGELSASWLAGYDLAVADKE